VRKAMLLCGIAAVLGASLFAIPALASSRDGNGDRIPDCWEGKYHLSLAKDQAPRDQDRDGVKNLADYREGTSPLGFRLKDRDLWAESELRHLNLPTPRARSTGRSACDSEDRPLDHQASWGCRAARPA
jgi:hypothetical protein